MTPEARASADKFDSDLKQKKQKEQKIKRSNKALTEARIKSADEYQRRSKRNKEHEELNQLNRALEAEEQHFEKKVKPRTQGKIERADKIMARRPNYTCLLLFYAPVTVEEENEAKKFKSTITHGGTKHEQVFASLTIYSSI